MKRKPVEEMTNEELRIEIAKEKGFEWKDVLGAHAKSPQMQLIRDSFHVGAWISGDGKTHFDNSVIPYWPLDIQAMWILEDEIPREDREIYSIKLFNVIARKIGQAEMGKSSYWKMLHANSRERAEAWIEWKRMQNEKESPRKEQIA